MTLGETIFEKLKGRYDRKELILGAPAMRYHERIVMLSVLDGLWKDHLLAMDHLKEGIGLRGYAQQDPLVAYKKESFEMFEQMMMRFQEDTARHLFRMQIIGPDGQPIDPETVTIFTNQPPPEQALPASPRHPELSAGDASASAQSQGGVAVATMPQAVPVPRSNQSADHNHRRSRTRVPAQEAARARCCPLSRSFSQWQWHGSTEARRGKDRPQR